MRKPWRGLRSSLLRPDFVRQGVHPDPEDPATPPPPALTGWERDLADSAAMRAFESGLLGSAPTVREAVLDELSTYWERDRAEVLKRCLNWEDYSVEEWQQRERGTAEGLLDFYQQCESWAYDLLWYDYLRTCGYAIPFSVPIAEWLAGRVGVGTHLDFGSGSGSTSVMFSLLGWESAVGDISMPLLDFATWRAGRRDLPIKRFDLRETLPQDAFDVVTAIDTMAHVPDPYQTALSLHRAIRKDGYLFANFDVREPSDYNAWHLYSQSFGLHWDIRRAGFVHVATVAGSIEVFQRADPDSSAYRRSRARAALRYGPPSRPAWAARRVAFRGARRVAQRIWGQR